MGTRATLVGTAVLPRVPPTVLITGRVVLGAADEARGPRRTGPSEPELSRTRVAPSEPAGGSGLLGMAGQALPASSQLAVLAGVLTTVQVIVVTAVTPVSPRAEVVKVPRRGPDVRAAAVGVAAAVLAGGPTETLAVAAVNSDVTATGPTAGVPVVGGATTAQIRAGVVFPAPLGRDPRVSTVAGTTRQEAGCAETVAGTGALIPAPPCMAGAISVRALRRPIALGPALITAETAAVPTSTAIPAAHGRAPPRRLGFRLVALPSQCPIRAVAPVGLRAQLLGARGGLGATPAAAAVAVGTAAAAAVLQATLVATTEGSTLTGVVPVLATQMTPGTEPVLAVLADPRRVVVTVVQLPSTTLATRAAPVQVAPEMVQATVAGSIASRRRLVGRVAKVETTLVLVLGADPDPASAAAMGPQILTPPRHGDPIAHGRAVPKARPATGAAAQQAKGLPIRPILVVRRVGSIVPSTD